MLYTATIDAPRISIAKKGHENVCDYDCYGEGQFPDGWMVYVGSKSRDIVDETLDAWYEAPTFSDAIAMGNELAHMGIVHAVAGGEFAIADRRWSRDRPPHRTVHYTTNR